MDDTKTHDIRKHITYENTWHTKTHDIRKHMTYENAWHTKTHDIRKYMTYANTCHTRRKYRTQWTYLLNHTFPNAKNLLHL
jgi:hypothetical protein